MQEYQTPLQGTWAYDAARLQKAGFLTKGLRVDLRRETDNQYDSNAIAAFLNGSMLGYVPKGLAAKITPLIDRGAHCTARIARITKRKPKPPSTDPFPGVSIKISFPSYTIPTSVLRLYEIAEEHLGDCGVYQISCTTTSKSYVGSSKNIGNRWRKHLNELEQNKHFNQQLQNDWNQYKPDTFNFEILEVTHHSNREEREGFWILTLDSCNQGYNVTHDGLGRIPSGIDNSQVETGKNSTCPISLPDRKSSIGNTNSHTPKSSRARAPKHTETMVWWPIILLVLGVLATIVLVELII